MTDTDRDRDTVDDRVGGRVADAEVDVVRDGETDRDVDLVDDADLVDVPECDADRADT